MTTRTTINPQGRIWRETTSRHIRGVCRSMPFRQILARHADLPPESRSLLVAAALQRALDAGELCAIYGYALDLHAPARWRGVTVRLAHGIYADAAGVVFEREIRRRGLTVRPADVFITAQITPLPTDQAAWAEAIPGAIYDQATVDQLGALFCASPLKGKHP